jgi:hypothetical protein
MAKISSSSINTAPTGQTLDPAPHHGRLRHQPLVPRRASDLSVFERYLSLWVGLCVVVEAVLRLTTFRAVDVAAIT